MASMKKRFDKFSVLSYLSTSKSYPSKDWTKCSGYLREWNISKMLVDIVSYLDILEPAKTLEPVSH